MSWFSYPVSKEAENTGLIHKDVSEGFTHIFFLFLVNTNKLCMNNVHINRLTEISCDRGQGCRVEFHLFVIRSPTAINKSLKDKKTANLKAKCGESCLL